MSMHGKLRHIGSELKRHAPFTMFGALLGIVFMLIFRNLPYHSKHTLFYIFHPTHVVLSAMVTASMFRLHDKKKNFLIVLLIGYFGSVGIATLSDSIIPFFGERILGVNVPTHAALHKENDKPSVHEHENHGQGDIHIGFIEKWYIVNPAAILGVLIAYFLPRTRFPHAAHILISTWASAAHIIMNIKSEISILIFVGIFVVLFISVWLPCCASDIVFPLLFIKDDSEMCMSIHNH